MSEMEVPQGDALPEELIAPDATVEETAEESSTSEEVETEQDAEKAPQPRKPGIQRRLDELTANWREEQRRARQLEEQNAELLRRVLQSDKAPEPKAPTQPVTEPKLDQFQTYDEYVGALADYKAEQRIQAWQNEQRAQQEAQQRANVQSEFQRRAAEFRAEASDFDMVAFNPSLPVSDAMAEAINASDMGPQVLYYLGKNPNEAARIAALPAIQAARELGRLETRISLPQPKTVTSAPKPVTPLDGGGSSRAIDPDKMTTEEWKAWRNQSLGRK